MFLEVDVKYPKRLQNLHNDLPFLPERMKINKSNKLVCNLYDKNKLINVISLYVICMIKITVLFT